MTIRTNTICHCQHSTKQGSPQGIKFSGAQAIAARSGAPEHSEGVKLCAKGAGVGVGGVSSSTGGGSGEPPSGKSLLQRCSESTSLAFQASDTSSLYEMSYRFWWQFEVGFMRFPSKTHRRTIIKYTAIRYSISNLPEYTCSFMK